MIDAEIAFVSACLADTVTLDTYRESVLPSDLENRIASTIYGWMVSLRNQGIEPSLVTLASYHRADIEALTGGIDAFMATANAMYHAWQVPSYVATIRDQAARRKLINLGMKLSRDTETSEMATADLVSLVEQEAARLRIATSAQRPNAVDEWLEHLERSMQSRGTITGIPSGFGDVDRMTLGWQRTDSIIVAARTSIGKSAFAIQCAINAATADNLVQYISLEMSRNQIMSRIASNLTGVKLQSFRQGDISDEDMGKIVTLALPILERIEILDHRIMGASQIAGEMRRAKHERGLDLCIVDYAQMVSEPPQLGDNAGSALGRVAVKLRQASQDADCALLILSQITRAVDSRSDKRPMLSDLAGSGGLEASADVTLLLYRDDYYDPESEKKNLMEINVAKQRNGPTGKAELVFLKDTQRLVNLDRR